MRLGSPDPLLEQGFAQIRAELGLTEAFPPDVLAETAAATVDPHLKHADARDVALVTIDPPGSRDLDQAYAAERRASGYRVHYAIADVAAFVRPGGAVDVEARRRGQTHYLPDGRVPLHPPDLGEGRASLLPDVERPALLWAMDLDAEGAVTDFEVRRASVRSRAQLTYAEAQRRIDDGTADDSLVLLRQVGRLRLAQEAERGGVHLDLPEQEVVRGTDGRFGLTFRAALPVEDWNAQISLLTGMCAARLMVDGGVGLLRTLPAPEGGVVDTLRRSARCLGVPWPSSTGYAEVVRRLDPQVPAQAALLTAATRLLRGAGYLAFDGEVPAAHTHGAVASAYAHVTAPLRRLADRFANEVVLALSAGTAVPGWARDALPELPGLMAESGRRDSAVERAVVDLVEAAVLESRVGSTFEGVVVQLREGGGLVQLVDPAVLAFCAGTGLELGSEVRVRVAVADVTTRKVELTPA